MLGEVDGLDLDEARSAYDGPGGRRRALRYDRLVLAAGSVNKLLPIPGVAEHAHGFRGIPEAVYLRDHLIRQVELADATDDQDEPGRALHVRRGRRRLHRDRGRGAGRAVHRACSRSASPRLRDQQMRWMLLDIADRVLPELDKRLSRTADRVLRERGVEVRMGRRSRRPRHDGVRLDRRARCRPAR